MNTKVTKTDTGFTLVIDNDTYSLTELQGNQLTHQAFQAAFKKAEECGAILQKSELIDLLKQVRSIELLNSYIVFPTSKDINDCLGYTPTNGFIEIDWFKKVELFFFKRAENSGLTNKFYLLEKIL